ncbi:MAG: class I SAM-dependent methyltransferase [Alphaproteobacteria bacterium]|nr:class I SAM-dependent methyltransferase [Alphaproteobacteria bacterium]MCW5740091.1 class I SAM-dependent methyltransferase [Alphaproteobacteria bacterium]
MDRIYRHQRHVYDATRKFYLLGRDRLIAGLRARDCDHVLEIGCGTARNLIIAAQRYPGARLYGIDLSVEMLATAERAVRRAGLVRRIRLARADAAVFDPQALFGVARFQRVFASYSLSMIPPWREALAQAIGAVAPGGQLHVVDFGEQSRLPAIFRFALRRWLAAFHVTPHAELEAALAERAATLGATLRCERPHRDYARYAVLALPMTPSAASTADPSTSIAR